MKYQFATYKNAALNAPIVDTNSACDAIAEYTTAVTTNATNDAGNNRRNRRA